MFNIYIYIYIFWADYENTLLQEKPYCYYTHHFNGNDTLLVHIFGVVTFAISRIFWTFAKAAKESTHEIYQ